ncbi:hypothetical protein PHYBLDRAFT_70954 [Phycomyces blakesleeanus NRRL 1555(-)]|uniref:Uncharacterized protein n=1 Tax=Phycomyces blakesleeanus (strain ATCC 8743b / DSM 1359 / FGSC 10004 / NBRC 33097 / NRRL 1555) TaxID=763407 RepID=A0A167JKZ9_PHYB8|nr:hypothetical protein PHYBLDRAFT_70954 [Phycomyces blakesleeanus NRRL 1555(-)]OAD66209.1 hypothetical protein PHYBLDRAFT_70954 [Phycomyces blakesleeanus NRRL 1555(-)]|eukprot:XP_018284249.1 hypothetical protein PHYBLDRAFT_70954 [Phycomyces blakesleeanus NRRL 1555(-)]
MFGNEVNAFYVIDSLEDEESENEMTDDKINDSLKSILELNLLHRFIVISVALFVTLYIIDKGAVILIAIFNKILRFLFDPFCLPVSVSGLKRLAKFNALTNGIKKYINCSKCHIIYENNNTSPICCTLPVFGKHSLCGNSLFKTGFGSIVPKKTFVFHSVKKALKTFFQCPNFENNINSWNCGPKIENTLFDVYDETMWNELVDVDGILFLDTARSLMLTLNID